MGAGIVAFATVALWHVVFLHMLSAWLFTLVTLHGISGCKVIARIRHFMTCWYIVDWTRLTCAYAHKTNINLR